MAKGYAKQKTTVRRSMDEYTVEELPKLHRNALLTLVNLCLVSGIGVYIGKARRSGAVGLKFYTSEGIVEDFIEPGDNPIETIAGIGADVLPKPEQRMLADDLAALTPQEGSGRAKTGSLVRRVISDDSSA